MKKKILELSKTEGLSEETKLALTILKNQVKEDEKRLINEEYTKGFYDKEMNKKPNWNYFDTKYKNYFSDLTFGQIK